MKRILLLFCFILMGHGILHAQEANRSLKEIITSIENETGYSFVYSENVDLSQRKEVVVNEKTLKNILSAVFKGTGIAYKIDGKHIVLLKESEKNLTDVVCEGPPLPEIVVDGNKSPAFSPEDIELSGFDIRKILSPFGEPDLVKSLQQLPGIQTGTGLGASDFYVRGGEVDQNLVLLDGVPVYNNNHFLGLFSIFNGDAIQKASLYKSEFPARFGERLSSVVDVRSKTGNMQHYHGSLSLGLISSHFNLEGPIVKDKTSFNISARRSYFDLFTWVAEKIVHDDGIYYGLKSYFYDVNAGITHKFSDRSLLHFNFYSGKDKTFDTFRHGYYSKFDPSITQEDNDRWGNTIASLCWDYKLSPKLFARTAIAYSNYTSESNYLTTYPFAFPDKREIIFLMNYNRDLTFILKRHSGIQDRSIKTDWEFLPNNLHHVRFGAGHIFHTFKPEIWTDNRQNSSKNTSGSESFLYIEDEMALSKQWKANMGLRFSSFSNSKDTWLSLQPRISLGYEANRNLSFKASYATMSQYIQSLTDGISSSPADLWVPVIGSEPMRSQQFTLGAFYDTKKGYDFSMEGFYKHMTNLQGYKNRTGWNSGSSVPWFEQIELGTGRSYGIEFLARKTTGRLTGWLAYTLAWSDRQFPTINGGNRFPAQYDRRHDLKINATYKLNQKIDFSAAWTIYSGMAYTFPVEGYALFPGHLTERYEGRNNFRLPSTHRLDLSMNYYRKKNAKGRQGIWNFGLYNVYGKSEPYSLNPVSEYYFKQYYVRSKSFLPIPIPSVSYTYKF